MGYVSQEDIELAKQMDLLTYLQNYEPQELVCVSSNTYCTREHDSLKISNGKWCWFSHGIGGKTALDYLIKVKEYPFVQAVETILGRTASKPPVFCCLKTDEEKTLLIPELNDNTDAVVRYLKGRGVHPAIINYCLKNKLLLESKKYQNAIFIGYDLQGIPKHGSVRGTLGTYKGDLSGSDKRYSFAVPGKSDTVHVFESAIDLLSFATLELYNGRDWHRDSLLSLAGVYKTKRKDIHTFPDTFFFGNIGVYFKLVQQDVSQDHIELLNAAIKGIKEAREQERKTEKPEQAFDKERKSLEAKVKAVEVKIEKVSAKLAAKKQECESLSAKAEKINAVQSKLKTLNGQYLLLQEENSVLHQQMHAISEAFEKTQCRKTELELHLNIILEEERNRQNRVKCINAMPKRPCDIDEFKEYFGYNLANLGINPTAQYWDLLLDHLSHILFLGIPIAVSQAVANNMACAVSNTLTGHKNVESLSFTSNITIEDIEHFLCTSGRVVCLNAFIGNYNETELFSLLNSFRDKIVFITFTYEKVLGFLPQELLLSCNYFNPIRSLKI